MRLLVIDDDAAYTERLHAQLLPLFPGMDWTTVTTVADGLASLQEAAGLGNPYDILIMDLLLPGDAFNIVRLPELYTTYPDLFIIGLTVRPLPTTPALTIGANTLVASKEDAPAVVQGIVQAGRRDGPE